MSVFVLDKRGDPLMPCTERRARVLLQRGRAQVHRVVPFVIRLVDREQATSVLQPVRLKIDPGSKVTGVALVRETEPVDTKTGEIKREATVMNLMEIEHRGASISERLKARAGYRRRRRSANLRYRAPRFNNRTRSPGWLAPSLRHRVETTTGWVGRIRRWAPVTGISIELVRFDLQKMADAEISGVQYQQGTLAGYEVREYVLEKWGRQCAYCDARGVPLNLDHVQARGRGGSDRVTNLVPACVPCNEEKGSQPIELFLKDEPVRLARIKALLTTPLKDAAAVNSTRWALFGALKATGVPVECSSGGRTKWNRARLGIPKSHALDGACVGRVDAVDRWRVPTLRIKATGSGEYCRTRTDASGFPRGYCTREKCVKGFRTGDLARATVTEGAKAGVHVGRVAVRASGSFNFQTKRKLVQGIHARHFKIIQRADGYGYQIHRASSLA